MAPHSFFNKSNNDHIQMQRHCLFPTLPPLLILNIASIEKNKTEIPDLFGIRDIEAALTATCDEGEERG